MPIGNWFIVALYIYFVRENSVKIWGITSRQRMERVLSHVGATQMGDDIDALHDDDAALILRADYLIDDRLVNYLAATPNSMLQIGEERAKAVVAAHVPARLARQTLGAVEDAATVVLPPGSRASGGSFLDGFEQHSSVLAAPVWRVCENHRGAAEILVYGDPSFPIC